jgi:crotonobetainyl-CoA:carnitine CoA-transferase CaiB-like acyl-CoA transferase
VRVLDLTRLLPGPVCTLHLADLGADVIKIEDTGAGDYARTMGMPPGRESPMFRAINRGKRMVTLDLKQAEGVDLFLRLARTAHIVVEQFRPGVVDRLGVGYDAVRAVNPAIVYCSISGYGQTGPMRDLAGHDLNYCAIAGLTDQIGPAGGDPVIPNFQIADLLGGAVIPAMTILAVLHEATRTGQGRHIDIAMTEGVLAHHVQGLTALALHGRAPAREDDLLSGREACYRIYRTADGRHMAVGALEKKFWDGVCDVVGRPDLKPLHWSLGADSRPARDALAAIFATQPQAHWIERFAPTDCCVTPVLTMEEARRHPQHAARGMFRDDPGADGDRVLQYSPPFKLSDDAAGMPIPAREPGADTAAVLAEVGVDAELLAALDARGVM